MDSIKLFSGDCLEILKTIADESIDLVVTDCPYKIVSGGVTKVQRNDACKGIFNGRNFGKHTDWNEHVRSGKLFKHNDIQFKDWLPDLYRVLKPKTHCYIMISSRNLTQLQTEAEKVGFKFQNLLIWEKGNLTPNRYYMQGFECILMLRKGNARNINNLGTSNIIRVPNIIGKKQHPTEKPVELMRVLIENSSNHNDIVLDPFMGSGSTILACLQSGRRAIGIEIDSQYFDIAKHRIDTNENI